MSLRSGLLKYAGYSLFFLFCLLFFLVKGFPVQQIKDRLEQNLRQSAGVALRIDRVSTLFPNGLEAGDVKVTLPASGEGKEGYTLRLDRLSARISLLRLLLGKKKLSFKGELFSGKLRGDLELGAENWRLRGELAGVDLGKIPYWIEWLGQQLSGRLSLEADLQVAPKDLKLLQGTLHGKLEGGKLGQGKVYGVELPLVDLGKTEINLDIQKGKAEIKAASIKSEDLEASLEGYFLLQSRFSDTSANCRLRVKPSEAKMAEVKAKIPPEFHGMLEGQLNRARGADGHLRYNILGRIFAGGASFQPLRQ